MFNKKFEKIVKITALLPAAVMLCGLAGCGKDETVSSAPDNVPSVPQSIVAEKSEAAQNTEESSDNGAVSVDGASLKGAASRNELSEPFTSGSFTVEPPVYPWNDDDVKTAWQMTDHYGKWTTFSDCVFIDFTGDNIAELLLVCGGDKIFYIFQKNGEEISLSAKSDYTALFYHSAFLIDPPMEENGFHYDDPIPNRNYTRDKFAVFEDSSKQKYIVMFAWSGTLGMVCEIKRIEIHDGEITLPVVYRWGLFKELGYDAMNIVMRYKKHLGDDDYEEVPKKEISDFLNSLTILTDTEQDSTPNWFSKCLEYDWARSEGLMISSTSEYMTGPLFTVSFSDLNLDGTPEVILSQKYSNRVPQINDIYVINNDGISYRCSFYGTLGDDVSVYTDKNTGMKTFVCEDTMYGNSIESRTTIYCRYFDDFTGFECVPLCSSHRDDVRSETRYCSELDADNFNGENESSKLLTEEEYNSIIEDFMGALELSDNVCIKTSPKLVHSREGLDDSLCASENEMNEMLNKLYSEYANTALEK